MMIYIGHYFAGTEVEVFEDVDDAAVADPEITAELGTEEVPIEFCATSPTVPGGRNGSLLPIFSVGIGTVKSVND
jgi:hypothetical protein